MGGSIISFARIWSVDRKDFKILVIAISPGVIQALGYDTSPGMAQEQVDQIVLSSIDKLPLVRPGTADKLRRASCSWSTAAAPKN